jgi:putative glutamine amidotransferase
LFQHLPAMTAELHRVPEHDREPVHAVVIEPASRLAGVTGVTGISGSGPLGVNSLHHQSVDRVGAGLRPVAWSPEGVVEAIEGIDQPWLGVQWHPELLTDRCEHARLFTWLAGAAVQWRDRRRDEVAMAAAVELFEAVA